MYNKPDYMKTGIFGLLEKKTFRNHAVSADRAIIDNYNINIAFL